MNSIEPDEAEDQKRVVDELRKLAPCIQPSTDPAWSRKPALRVLDCVLSLERNYDAFVVPRLNSFERSFPRICSVSELHTEIESYASPHDFVRDVLRYNHKARAEILARVTRWL